MELEEFDQLATAWGADLARWPADAQDPARRLMAARSAEASGVLDAARLLDRALRASSVAAPSLALRARVISAAPEPRQSLPSWRGWFGAALAASCAAGALAGLLAISLGLFPGHGAMNGDPAAEAAGLLRASSDATEG